MFSPCRKDVPMEHVTHADREQTKRVVYAVVYGAGRLQAGSWGFGVTCKLATVCLCLNVAVPQKSSVSPWVLFML